MAFCLLWISDAEKNSPESGKFLLDLFEEN